MKCGTVISVEHRITVLSELYKNWVLSSHCERVRFKSFWESQIQVIVRESSSSRCERVKFKSLRESQIRVIVRELSSSHCERVRFKSLWESQIQVIVRESSSSRCERVKFKSLRESQIRVIVRELAQVIVRELSSILNNFCLRPADNTAKVSTGHSPWEFLVWKLKILSSIIC